MKHLNRRWFREVNQFVLIVAQFDPIRLKETVQLTWGEETGTGPVIDELGIFAILNLCPEPPESRPVAWFSM